MTTSITASVHFAQIYELLIATYGEPQCVPDYDPLGGLVATILSQHTSDSNSGRAYQQLITTFPTWEGVRDAPTNEVANAIRCGGLANVKAPRIQDALLTLTQQRQNEEETTSLSAYLYDQLARRTSKEAWHYLRSLPGVGPKTAACVLMFHMGLPVMPIDTHVHRTSKRLGLIRSTVSADQAHELFAQMVPPEWVYALHVNLIQHGRQVCHAQRPECGRCPLYGECAYVGSVNVQETAFQPKNKERQPRYVLEESINNSTLHPIFLDSTLP